MNVCVSHDVQAMSMSYMGWMVEISMFSTWELGIIAELVKKNWLKIHCLGKIEHLHLCLITFS